MVAPGFLANPEVLRWLNGVMPVWTVLDAESLKSLQIEPAAGNQAIRIEASLAETDLSGSAVVCTARTLLQRAVDADGLALTATGNLSRKVVAEMIGIIEWPGLDKDELFQLNKQGLTSLTFCRYILSGCCFNGRDCSKRVAVS